MFASSFPFFSHSFIQSTLIMPGTLAGVSVTALRADKQQNKIVPLSTVIRIIYLHTVIIHVCQCACSIILRDSTIFCSRVTFHGTVCFRPLLLALPGWAHLLCLPGNNGRPNCSKGGKHWPCKPTKQNAGRVQKGEVKAADWWGKEPRKKWDAELRPARCSGGKWKWRGTALSPHDL